MSKIDPRFAKFIMDCVADHVQAPLEPRNAAAILSSPFSVKSSFAIDPSVHGTTVISQIAKGLCTGESFKTFGNIEQNMEYKKLLAWFVDSFIGPAAAMSMCGETFPHVVMESLFIPAEKNEALVRLIPSKSRRRAVRNMRKDNMLALFAYKSLPKTDSGFVNAHVSASTLAEEVRLRQQRLDNHLLSGLTTPSAFDVLSNVSARAMHPFDIKVFAPRRDNLYFDRNAREVNLVRSYTTRSVLEDKAYASRAANPLIQAAHKAAIAKLAIQGTGGDATVFEEAWGMAWFGSPVSLDIPNVTLDGKNFRRLADRSARKTYCIQAFPNFAGNIKVNASTTLRHCGAVH